MKHLRLLAPLLILAFAVLAPAHAFAAAHLAALGCASAIVWVLRQNQSRWFYERLGGKVAAEAIIEVGGAPVAQTAYVWSPIEKLVQATSAAP